MKIAILNKKMRLFCHHFSQSNIRSAPADIPPPEQHHEQQQLCCHNACGAQQEPPQHPLQV